MINLRFDDNFTAWKVSKCGVISGLYLPVFSPNTGKYGPEITPYLNTFHRVMKLQNLVIFSFQITINDYHYIPDLLAVFNF